MSSRLQRLLALPPVVLVASNRVAMTLVAQETILWLRSLADALQDAQEHPHGPEAERWLRDQAGKACVALCAGNANHARTLWKLIIADTDGYMPAGVATALVRAADTSNLVPDIEAPEVT